MHALEVGVGAGLWFGVLAFSGWLYWLVVGAIVLVELGFASKKAIDEEIGVMSILLAVLVVTLHLFGVIDVINLVRHNYMTGLMWLGGLLGIGLLYSPAALYLNARLNRAKFTRALQEAKREWFAVKTSSSNARQPANTEALEQEWSTTVKAKKWAEITSVENDKGRILFWIVFWPLHLFWKVIFQWAARIRDLYNLCWTFIRTTAQRIKSAALKGADADI